MESTPTQHPTRLPNARWVLLLGLVSTALVASPLLATAQAAPVEIRGNCIYVLPDGVHAGPVYATGAWICSYDPLPTAPSLEPFVKITGNCVYVLPGGIHAGPVLIGSGPWACTV